ASSTSGRTSSGGSGRSANSRGTSTENSRWLPMRACSISRVRLRHLHLPAERRRLGLEYWDCRTQVCDQRLEHPIARDRVFFEKPLGQLERVEQECRIDQRLRGRQLVGKQGAARFCAACFSVRKVSSHAGAVAQINISEDAATHRKKS